MTYVAMKRGNYIMDSEMCREDVWLRSDHGPLSSMDKRRPFQPEYDGWTVARVVLGKFFPYD